jgi:hypothetical protein
MDRGQIAFPLAEDRSNGAARPAAAVKGLPPAVDGQRSTVGTAPVELVDGPPAAVSGWVRGTTTVAVLLVAVVAAVASYEHMRALAVVAGEGWRSWLLPISVDGLAVAASMTMLVRRRAGLPAGGLAWVALLLGLGASMAANVAAAEPTVEGRLVAAWPPVALLLAYELLMQQVGHRTGEPG